MANQAPEPVQVDDASDNMMSVVFGIIVVIIAAVVVFNYFKNRGQVTPEGETTTMASPSPESVVESYTVVKGDTLWKISEKLYNDGYQYKELEKANKDLLKNGLTAGLVLTVPKLATKPVASPAVMAKNPPEASAAPTSVVKPTAAPAATQPQMTTPTVTGSEYVVVKGDSLWKIAVAAYGDGYKWTKIYQANKATVGSNPGLIYSGVKLVIPGK